MTSAPPFFIFKTFRGFVLAVTAVVVVLVLVLVAFIRSLNRELDAQEIGPERDEYFETLLSDGIVLRNVLCSSALRLLEEKAPAPADIFAEASSKGIALDSTIGYRRGSSDWVMPIFHSASGDVTTRMPRSVATHSGERATLCPNAESGWLGGPR